MPKKNRQCEGKARHATRENAAIQARKSLNVGFNVYRCGDCKFWHVGKSRSPTRAPDRIGALLAKHADKLAKRMSCNN